MCVCGGGGGGPINTWCVCGGGGGGPINTWCVCVGGGGGSEMGTMSYRREGPPLSATRYRPCTAWSGLQVGDMNRR